MTVDDALVALRLARSVFPITNSDPGSIVEADGSFADRIVFVIRSLRANVPRIEVFIRSKATYHKGLEGTVSQLGRTGLTRPFFIDLTSVSFAMHRG